MRNVRFSICLEPTSIVWIRFGTAQSTILARKSCAVLPFGTAIPLFGTWFQILFSRKSLAKRQFFQMFGTDFYCLEPLWNRQEGRFREEVLRGFAIWNRHPI